MALVATCLWACNELFGVARQAQDYRIQYDSIVRLFVLPKSNVPQTLVVISLDPPIRKGQTYYPHILCQFNNDDELNIELDITEEQLEAKNEKVCWLLIVLHQLQSHGACPCGAWHVPVKYRQGPSFLAGLLACDPVHQTSSCGSIY